MKVEELHKILYEILLAIDSACEKENITYSLGGGTLLGAIRNHGFIPWDDDIDICVWYQDYDALKKALEKHLPEHLRLVEPKDLCPHFFDFVPRVIDERYYWHESTEEDLFYQNKQNHVCVDIFLVANSANSKFKAKQLILQQKILYGLAMGHRYRIKNKNFTLFQRIQSIVLSCLGRLFPMEYILKKRDKIFRKYENMPGKYCIITNDIPKYWDLLYERAWFDGVVRVPFEDKMLPVQTGYDQKLSLQYGDYMKPPKDKTEYISHMDFEE